MVINGGRAFNRMGSVSDSKAYGFQQTLQTGDNGCDDDEKGSRSHQGERHN
jgi:hypothetical protein